MELKTTFEHYYPDGVKGGQCGVFAHKLVQFPLVGDTITSKKAAVKKYGKIGPLCSIGDVLVLDVGTVAGHIAIVNDDKGLFWQLTESNWKGDERVHHTRLLAKTSTQIYGFIRGPLKVAIYNPMKTARVTLYRSNIQNPDIINQGLTLLGDKLKAKFGEDFSVLTEVLDTNAHFDGQIFTDGKIDVFPSQILALDAKGAKVICLVHNGVQPPPTNPFHSAETLNGTTPIQIPENWYVTFPNVFCEFYLHELLHAWYYLAGNLPYDQQIAKVHNPPDNWGGYNNPTDYYLSLIEELRPYWGTFSSQPQGVTMTVVFFKVKGKPAIYEFVNNSWRGYDDPISYGKDTSGKIVKIIELDQVEFDKLTQLFPI